ncbi:hypothetical protein Tco_0249328 [Tanacetum coccineum]
MFKRRLIAADQASVFMAMTFEQSSSSLGRQCQMVSAENNTSGPASFLKDKRRQTMTTLNPCRQDKMLFLQQKRQIRHNKG